MNAPIDNLSYYAIVEHDGGTHGVVLDKRPTWAWENTHVAKLIRYGMQRPGHRFEVVYMRGTFVKTHYFVKGYELCRMDDSGCPATACANIRDWYNTDGTPKEES